MIASDWVVVVVLGDVCGGGHEFVEDPQVRATLVGGDLDRRRLGSGSALLRSVGPGNGRAR
jgi:hypothetical protein